jgi:Domain of unknown function (DUF3291)
VPPPSWHLAQVNVATLLAPITSTQLSGFVARLEEINALADGAPGFVWRLQTEDGDATAIRAFDDGRIIVNMSVWKSIEALGAFVYRSRHIEVLRRRREWFARMTTPILALWWVPAGATPTVADAKRRLDLLERLGPTPDAFTFREPFPPPGSDAPVERDDRWLCPSG